ncbi:hypothetical protein AVEN_205475-1 [Araneus ventricosus]|uniref:Uncharacterized protein n=1 Tax=Araneus ventricosus TaxID=182803 RepID=A0A4Y2CDJ6_ARAVE|nr:hypothetical protein AVEN_205475-1 [Araneus ventricosus]
MSDGPTSQFSQDVRPLLRRIDSRSGLLRFVWLQANLFQRTEKGYRRSITSKNCAPIFSLQLQTKKWALVCRPVPGLTGRFGGVELFADCSYSKTKKNGVRLIVKKLL